MFSLVPVATVPREVCGDDIIVSIHGERGRKRERERDRETEREGGGEKERE